MLDPFEGMPHDPIEVFHQWLALAEKSEPNDPNAAALATATLSGVPNVRMVLIKGAEDRGLRLFSNEESQKGRELQENPVAALCFHWKSLRRQVRFQGEVSTLAREEVKTYFHSRSRASQIAAAISAQSQVLASRQELDEATRAFASSRGQNAVPLPDKWVGYLLVPHLIEFWMDGSDRLHDRLQFTRSGETWNSRRLYP